MRYKFHVSHFPLSAVRFPLHDHIKKHREWSSTQILLKYVIMQLLTMAGLIGIIFKVR